MSNGAYEGSRQGASGGQGIDVNFRAILSNHMPANTASGDTEDAKVMLLTVGPAAMQTDLIG